MIEKFDTKKWLKKLQLSEFPEPEHIELQHPVLLCHGYGAIASLVKPSPLYDVAMFLRQHNIPAFAPNIVPYASIEIRAEGWRQIIRRLVKQNTHTKLNVIAHSMAGLDIRYALAKLDIADHVSSLTTISTPHRGTSLAELSLKTPDLIKEKMGDLLDWMGNRVYPGAKSDSVGSAEQLTRAYVTEEFNPDVPNVEGIPYYSFSSAVGKGTDHPIKVISRYHNNYIFQQEGLNDGMVSVESSKWGLHFKTGNISHLEQMNLRIKDGRMAHFEAFWLEVMKTLQDQGH
jgi:triacylglycerol lipase